MVKTGSVTRKSGGFGALAGIAAAAVAIGTAELVAVLTGSRSAPLVAVDGVVVDHVPGAVQAVRHRRVRRARQACPADRHRRAARRVRRADRGAGGPVAGTRPGRDRCCSPRRRGGRAHPARRRAGRRVAVAGRCGPRRRGAVAAGRRPAGTAPRSPAGRGRRLDPAGGGRPGPPEEAGPALPEDADPARTDAAGPAGRNPTGRRSDARDVDEWRDQRRRFLGGVGAVLGAAAVAGLGGRWLSTRRGVSAARSAVRLPAPASPAPPVPAGADLSVPQTRAVHHAELRVLPDRHRAGRAPGRPGHLAAADPRPGRKPITSATPTCSPGRWSSGTSRSPASPTRSAAT